MEASSRTERDAATALVIARWHVIVAYVLSLGSFVAPCAASLSAENEVGFPMYGAAIAIFFHLVAVIIASFALRNAPEAMRPRIRRVRRLAILGAVLAPLLAFLVIWAIAIGSLGTV